MTTDYYSQHDKRDVEGDTQQHTIASDWLLEDARCRAQIIDKDPTETRRTWVRAPAGGGKTTFLLSIAKQHPARKFLLATFSKDLQLEVRARARKEGIRNLTVSTIDSLCYEDDGRDITPLTDKTVVQTFFPNMPANRWFTKKGARDVGKIVDAALRWTGTFRPCEYHAQVSVDTYILPNLLKRMKTYAGNRRALYDSGKALTSDASYDCILIDEVQDLDDMALALVERCPQSVIYVGDPMQQIYEFTAAFKCSCAFTPSPRAVHLFPNECTAKLYKTFRLNRSTVNMLRKRQPLVELVGHRDREGSIVHIGPADHLAFPGLCYLFRDNAELCEFVLRGSVDTKVLRGDQIAWDVRAFKFNKNTHNVSKFAAFCRRLGKAARESLATALEARSTRDITSTDHPVASTIHRAKGSEHECAVVQRGVWDGVAASDTDEEARIAYVAVTRHRGTLFVQDLQGAASGGAAVRPWVEKTAAYRANKKKRKREDGGAVCFF